MSSCGDSSSPGDNSPPTTISRVRRICGPSKRSASDFVEFRSDDEDSENEVSFSDASTGVPPPREEASKMLFAVCFLMTTIVRDNDSNDLV